jgi:hypothetical protein
MKKSRLDKKSETVKKSGFLRLKTFVFLGAIFTALTGIGILAFSELSINNLVSAQSPIDRKGDKKYIATKNTIVDRETGRLRKPNEQEIEEIVKSLKDLTKPSDENLPGVALPNGSVALDLEGGYAGTMLARPNPDGTFETRCVFTFEEATEFLGLVADNSQE